MNKIDKTVDARGLACPLPVVNTKKAIMELKENGTVKVLVDNEIAVQNLTKFAVQKKYSSEFQKNSDKEYEVIITAARDDLSQGNKGVSDTENSNTENNNTECEECNYGNNIENGMLVVISSNVMGMGDEKLGKTLLKAFIFALTKQDRYPERIIMFNSGAYISCEGSESLEDLQFLEEQGVDIATCGTCLDFYGLKEKLKVGTVTNMYDIVEKMENARKTVRP